MNRKYWIVISAIGFFVVISVALYINYLKIAPMPSAGPRHLFKVKEIYPTKPGGREWFIDMNNPTSDGIFDPG